MKLKKTITKREFYKIEKYCCQKMQELFEGFNTLSINNNGEIYLFANNEAGYGFKEKIGCCPFCGEKIVKGG